MGLLMLSSFLEIFSQSCWLAAQRHMRYSHWFSRQGDVFNLTFVVRAIYHCTGSYDPSKSFDVLVYCRLYHPMLVFS